MADAATMTIKAVLLPDDIQATLKDLSYGYTPADANDKWYYKLVTVVNSSNTTDLISGNFIESGYETIATTDKVKFLFIKNTATTDGSTTTDDSILLSLSGATVTNSSTDTIEIGQGESWFAKLPNVTVGDIHARTVEAGSGSHGSGSVQCIIAAIVDDL